MKFADGDGAIATAAAAERSGSTAVLPISNAASFSIA